MMTALGVAFGGALGALVRWAISLRIKPIDPGTLFDPIMQSPGAPRAVFPLHTFIANMAACLVLGVVVATMDQRAWHVIGMVFGFCGALGTYSTFSIELVDMATRGQWRMAVSYAATSILGGLLLLSSSLMLAE